jgi:hypothetical protein
VLTEGTTAKTLQPQTGRKRPAKHNDIKAPSARHICSNRTNKDSPAPLGAAYSKRNNVYRPSFVLSRHSFRATAKTKKLPQRSIIAGKFGALVGLSGSIFAINRVRGIFAPLLANLRLKLLRRWRAEISELAGRGVCRQAQKLRIADFHRLAENVFRTSDTQLAK